MVIEEREKQNKQKIGKNKKTKGDKEKTFVIEREPKQKGEREREENIYKQIYSEFNIKKEIETPCVRRGGRKRKKQNR